MHIQRNHQLTRPVRRRTGWEPTTDFIAKDEWPSNSLDLTSTHFTVMCGCNTSGISQTSLKAQDHSGAKKVHCSRSAMTCRRQRSTKLLTTFANVWTHEPRPVMDIWNRWYELYTEIFRLNSFSETVNKLSVLTRCLSSNSKVHDRCVVKSENSLGGWLRLIWHNFVKFRDNWIKFCHLA